MRVSSLFSELQEHVDVSEDIVLILAANKCDLAAANSKESKALMKAAGEYAESIGATLWKTAAKASINIDEMFRDVAESVYRRKMASNSLDGGDDDEQRVGFDDNYSPGNKKKKCC